MKIKTITCHDVYNVGASLQAYALQKYLCNLGHDTKIINYKPDYLRHYRLWWIPNPHYNKPFIRLIYLLAKFPVRLRNRLKDRRKKRFDEFTTNYLNVTNVTYPSFRALQKNPPEADLLIAGSDQIWNPVFQNGKDPAFFLQFSRQDQKKISYAASFAVEKLDKTEAQRMGSWLQSFDSISVREKSAVTILKEIGLDATLVCDPVFLLRRNDWMKLAKESELKIQEPFILVYDFDKEEVISNLAIKLKEKLNLPIYSVFSMKGADWILANSGPLEFLSLISKASLIVSNSFHATAFSLIMHKDFLVINRKEKINTRMRDLLEMFGLEKHLVDPINFLPICMDSDIAIKDWTRIDQIMSRYITKSEEFLRENI